jgi:hypothetical protein
VTYAGGGPGFSSGGYGYGDASHGSRAAVLKRIMAAIAAMQQPQVDSVDAKLQPGEFVVNSPAAAMAGPELQQLNDVGNSARGYVQGGAVSPPPSTAAGSTASEAGAGPAGWVMMALQAIPIMAALLKPQQGGPNGLERASAMGYGPETQHFAGGGFVRNPYAGRYGAGPTAAGSRYGMGPTATPYGARPGAQPTTNVLGFPVPPAPSTDPGWGLPTSQYDAQLRKGGAAGAFDPGYGMSNLEAALNRQNQGAQGADVRDLMASGMDDPSLYASQLLASRGARSQDASSALATARVGEDQRYQDWMRSLFAGRHQDQISELLARIK